MDDQQQSRWLTRRQILWAVGIIAVIVGAYIFLRFAYVREWKWTGLVKNPDFHKRTLWDWLSLLIVPAVLAVGGYLFTRSENDRRERSAKEQSDLDREISGQRTKEDRRIAQERAETDRQIADQRRQDDTLQAYLDQIGQLLLDKERPLRESNKGAEVRTLGRARTLTVLRRLDSERRGSVLQFLYEAGLIDKDLLVLDLTGADVSEANLSKANLGKAYLGGTNLRGANLIEVYLRGADLSEAKLSKANLSGAVLRGVNLKNADLRGADLSEAKMYDADLSGANLSGADLSRANLWYINLSGANLWNVNLSGANLSGAKSISNEQLEQAASLEGATMPNGQKYEVWLKSTGRESDEKNE